MMSGYSFRVRMKFADTRRLPLDSAEHLVYEDDHTVVWLRADEAIRDAVWVSLVGSSYGTEEGALAAGEEWRSRLSRSLAALSIGADFGDRAGGGGVGPEFQAEVKRTTGARGCPEFRRTSVAVR